MPTGLLFVALGIGHSSVLQAVQAEPFVLAQNPVLHRIAPHAPPGSLPTILGQSLPVLADEEIAILGPDRNHSPVLLPNRRSTRSQHCDRLLGLSPLAHQIVAAAFSPVRAQHLAIHVGVG
ncbi:hypothetical protein D3C75_567260 [compost metagenome]